MGNDQIKRAVMVMKINNQSGVLARVASLFGRRDFNIQTITVSTTKDPDVSRLTVVVDGDKNIIHQVISQTLKLEDALEVYEIDSDHALLRELLLVKLAANEHNRSYLRDVAEIYGANIIDLSPDSMVMELTGLSTKINAFLNVINQYQVAEICRTGVTAMERGLTADQKQLLDAI